MKGNILPPILLTKFVDNGGKVEKKCHYSMSNGFFNGSR